MSHPGCVFCPETGKVKIVDETEHWYLVFALFKPEGAEKVEEVNDAVLFVTKSHVVTLDELPPGALLELPLVYEVMSRLIRVDLFSINFTAPSRTEDHFHGWGVEQDPVLDPNVGTYTMVRRHRAIEAQRRQREIMGSTH